jgi:hypothetical protein
MQKHKSLVSEGTRHLVLLLLCANKIAGRCIPGQVDIETPAFLIGLASQERRDLGLPHRACRRVVVRISLSATI